LLYGIALWAGFEIMVLEICGFRVLPTYLGSSVVVTGTLLTIFMVLMSAGYYLGGLFSGGPRGLHGLFLSLMLAAGYAVVVAGHLFEPIAALAVSLRQVLPAQPYLQAGAPTAALTLVLYGPPVLILSLISPYWVRLRTAGSGERGDAAGLQSGLFMALATLGSIAGTVLGSFVLVPWVGVELTVTATAIVLFVLAVVGWVKLDALSSRVRAARVLGALCIAMALAVLSSTIGPS
jgi:hypothetical protein